ncbi:MAG: hypothetical protein ABH803_00320 [Candidatus Micrarchaeota archaeon]
MAKFLSIFGRGKKLDEPKKTRWGVGTEKKINIQEELTNAETQKLKENDVELKANAKKYDEILENLGKRNKDSAEVKNQIRDIVQEARLERERILNKLGEELRKKAWKEE